MIRLLLVLSCTGCSEPSLPDPPADVAALSAPPASPQPATEPAPDAPDAPDRVAVRHVLVAWKDAARAPSGVRRTQEEARRRAEEVRRRALAGEDFSALARTFSDDASAPRGGFLGGALRGTWVPAFEQAAFTLPVGGTSEVVETPFGFHVIRREALEEVHVAQILVQWSGLRRTRATRTREEARERAREAQRRLDAGEPFESVVRELSDGPMRERGGDLGWSTRGQFLPEFEDAAFRLAPGEVSGVVETTAGFHLIRRIE
ncbi:MAG: peptidylprolyl isomerase [Deltaproteobacteria bacterium]|nr:peptidylprolyl isomerase [Deltaproteobacteria bacterium]